MARKAADLTGQIFGRLTVVERSGSNGYNSLWKCKCACGEERVVQSTMLKSGRTQSCGCLQRELAAEQQTTHGLNGSHTHGCWRSMRRRCEDPKHPAYARYGGVGIAVDERWQVFENFLADMGEAPSPDHTIERLRNTEGYGPGNCRWATMEEQQNNRGNNVVVTINGKEQSLGRHARELGIPYSTLYDRYKKGLPLLGEAHESQEHQAHHA